MNPILLLLLAGSGAGLGEDALLLFALASQQTPAPTGTTTTTTTTPAAPPAAPAIDPFLLLLLLGGMGGGGVAGPLREGRRTDEGPERDKKPALLSGCGTGIDRSLLLTLLLTSQGGQPFGSLGTATAAPAPAATTGIDPTTLLLLALVGGGGGGDSFNGRDALRKHFIRQRTGFDPDPDSAESA